MAFLAPAFVGALGLTGTAAIVGQVAVGAAVSAGVGYLARSLAPEPTPFGMGAMGMNLSVRVEANAPREIMVGLGATAGSLVYRNVYGSQEYCELVYALSDFPCDGLEKVFVNGIERTWNPSTGAVSGYAGMQIRFHNGAWDQAADTALIANSSGRWTADYRGRGVCYVVVRMKYDAKLYQTGVPRFVFVVRGAKLYDWRKDSTAGGSGSHRWDDPATHEFTRNPVVISYNWMRGFNLNGQRVAGMNTPSGALPLDDWTAAANACDEAVSLKAGGAEPRYRAGGVLSTSVAHREVLRALISAMAGKLIDTGGVFRPLPGVSQASVLSFTDDDLIRAGDVEIIGKRSRNELVNAVFGSYADPGLQYESTAAPPRISPDDEAADGGVRLERHYALDLVTSPSQAQRVLEIFRRRGRYQTTVKVRLAARCTCLEAGDVVGWTSARYGYVNKLFEVVTAAVSDDHSEVAVTLVETANAIFTWSAGTDELDPEAPVTVPAGGGEDAISITSVVAAVAVSDGEAQTPYLGVSWTPPVDPSVVAIDLEYRRVGDTVALTDRILDPSTGGVFGILKAVQGLTSYEVRALPVTVPPRDGLTWSAWVEASAATEPTKVDVAVDVEIPPGSITPEMLDRQTRFMLGLISAVETVFGSVPQQVSDLQSQIDLVSNSAIQSLAFGSENQAAIRIEKTERVRDNSALAQQITTALAQLNGLGAVVQQQITARIEGDQALAESIDSVTTQVGEQTLTVQVIQQSIDGFGGRIANVMNANGHIIGYTSLDGSIEGTTFTVAASAFQVALLGVLGGEPVPVFTIAEVNGTPRIALRADIFGDGSITAEKLNAASIATLYISDPDTTYYFDFANGRLGRTDNKMTIDLKNIEFEMIFA